MNNKLNIKNGKLFSINDNKSKAISILNNTENSKRVLMLENLIENCEDKLKENNNQAKQFEEKAYNAMILGTLQVVIAGIIALCLISHPVIFSISLIYLLIAVLVSVIKINRNQEKKGKINSINKTIESCREAYQKELEECNIIALTEEKTLPKEENSDYEYVFNPNVIKDSETQYFDVYSIENAGFRKKIKR